MTTTINNKKFKQVAILIATIAWIGILGCSKGTFDINSPNPNAPSPSTVPSKYFLSAALTNTAAVTYDYGSTDVLNIWMGYWSYSGAYTPSPTYVLYQLTSDFAAGNWDNAYPNLENYQVIINNSGTDPDQVNFSAIALIMKSYVFQRIVDLYNDAPYTQALSNSNFNPAYDKASDIYTDLVVKIDSAIGLINTAPASAANPGSFDVMFGGDMSLWIKFANTLKLKILMRLTSVSGSSIGAELSGLTAADFLGAGEDAQINPGYSAAADNQEFPLYNDVGFHASGSLGTNADIWRANSYAVAFYTGNNDPRVNYVFVPNSGGVIQGRVFGSTAVEPNSLISAVNGSGVAGNAGQSAAIIPAFESFFLQAEATQRGYLSYSTAAALYQSGVEESFRLLYTNAGSGNDPIADADAYIGQAGNGSVNFSVATDPIKLIITQKWIACAGFDPLESYSDWRRLGIPSDIPISVAPGNTHQHIPFRLLYPTSETSYNSAQVNKEGTYDIFTNGPFWQP